MEFRNKINTLEFSKVQEEDHKKEKKKITHCKILTLQHLGLAIYTVDFTSTVLTLYTSVPSFGNSHFPYKSLLQNGLGF